MYNGALKCKFIVQWSLGRTDLIPENFRQANKSRGSSKFECIQQIRLRYNIEFKKYCYPVSGWIILRNKVP